MLTRLYRRFLILAAVIATSLALPALASADYDHVVTAGETLTSVAAQDGLSVAALAAANGLATTAELVEGSVLEIPAQGEVPTPEATTSAPSPASAPAALGAGTTASQTSTAAATGTGTAGALGASGGAGGSYVVAVGDTLTAIAERDGTSLAALAALNGLDPNRILEAGITLRLPVANLSTTSTGPATEADQPATATTVAQPGSASSPTSASAPSSTHTGNPTPVATDTSGPVATDEFVSAAEIGQIAAANGVPPALAEAIAWQESGFNNDEISSAGAVGVMQITPATWQTVDAELGGTLAPASAVSNVTAGVVLLHSLLAATDSQAQAVAAYYQGLASVQTVGLYDGTAQYVSDVLSLEQHFGAG